MPKTTIVRATALSICAALGLTALGGCNNHPLVGVTYEREQVCDESIMVPVVKPKVMLVVDRSGSMSDNPLDVGTRWQALHGVIGETVAGQDANTEFGLAMFPAGDAGKSWVDGACNAPSEIDVPVGPATGTAIMSTLPPADATTLGGTPAALTVELAADHLRSLEGDDPKLMVLVTDGAANCSEGAGALESLAYDEALQEAVASAQLDGITTYVVGIQISTEFDEDAGVVPAEQLDEVAILGGAPLDGEHKFYSVEDQAALAGALDAITAELGCTMQLDDAVDTELEARAYVDGQPFALVSDCESEDGWMYGADGTSITLCGQACADFQASGDIELEYVCE